MKLFKKLFIIILCLTLIFCSVPITTFAADSIDVAPQYPDNGYVQISKTGIKNTYGQKYDNLRDQFVIDLTKNPVDLSISEQIEFDIYIENSKTFKTIYQDRVLCFNISSSATNKMLERTNYMFITQVTQDGWNHIEIPVKATATDLTNVTYVYLSSGGGTAVNPLANKYLRIANICGTREPFMLDDIYDDNMIFQRNKPINITGTGVPGVKVKVEIIADADGSVVRTDTVTVGEDLKWAASLDAMEGGYDTYTLSFNAVGMDMPAQIRSNIRIGELFVASGQSNMELRMWETPEGADRYYKRGDYTEGYNQPNISLYNTPNAYWKGEDVPKEADKNHLNGSWVLGDTQAAHNVSAVAYYYAETMQKKLDVPVGMLILAQGGSSIFSWISKEAIMADDVLWKYVRNNSKYYVDESNWSNANAQQTYGSYYNIKVAAAAGLEISGVIWYQGCNEYGIQDGIYTRALGVLRDCFADTFNYDEGAMPFTLVQLAPYGATGLNIPKIWDQMTDATKTYENMGQVAIYDLPLDWNYADWAPFGTGGDPIHPTEKRPVGERLAEAMYARLYSKEESKANTPVQKSFTVKDGYILVDFDYVGDGLAVPEEDDGAVDGFSIAGADGVFVNAKAEIVDSNTVKVWSDVVCTPKNVAYAYATSCLTANLHSTNNGNLHLLAAPFITTKTVTIYPENTSWYSVDDAKITHFPNVKFETVDSWTASGATAEIVSDVKDRGAGSLKLTYTGESDSFCASPNFTNSDGNAYIDIQRNFTKYAAINFKVKNTGSAITLDKLSIKSAYGWYYAELDTALSADSGWVSVTADLTNLVNDYGTKSNYSALSKVTDIRLVFSDVEGAGAVFVDTFQMKPLDAHNYSNACDKTCNSCDVTRKTSHTYKSVITKATLTKNGKKQYKCTVCGYVSSKSSTIYRPSSFKLSTTSYTYNGKVKKPTVTVKDSAGKTISSSNYTVTYASGRKNVGKYKVTIKMKGNYSGTKTLYFKINPAKTTVKSLTAGTKSLKVYVTKKTAQVTGYQIYCSTSKSFSSNVTKKYITSYKTTSTTLKSLKAKKTYYVKVRTYKTVGGVKYYSGWSTYKYKKTK